MKKQLQITLLFFLSFFVLGGPAFAQLLIEGSDVDQASATKRGTVRLATPAEVSAGAASDLAVTPGGLASAFSAYATPLVSARAPLDYLHVTGGLANAHIIASPGAAGTLGAGDFTIIIPAIQISATGQQLLFCSSSSATGYGAGCLRVAVVLNDIEINLGASGDSITKRANGAASRLGAAPSSVIVTRSGKDWRLYVGGKAEALVASGSVGSPTWADPIITAYWRIGNYHSGITSIESAFGPFRVLNRAWSQTDVDHYTATGRVPPQDEATGTMVPAINDTLSNDHAGWATSNAGTITDNDGFATMSATTRDACVRRNGFTYGRKYRVSFDYRANVAGNLYIGYGSPAWVVLSDIVADGEWHTVEVEFEHIASSAGTSLALWRNAGYPEWDMRNFRATLLGSICAFDIGRTAQVRGRYNSIHATITPGITPMPARVPEVEIVELDIAATGYLGGDQSLYFDPALVSSIELMPTTAAIPTVTIRRGSSGGTVIASSVSAGAQNQWSGPVTLQATGRLLEAGDKIHVTLSSAANVKVRIKTERR